MSLSIKCLILVLFSCLLVCTRAYQHTKVYSLLWTNNTNYDFFDLRTFGLDLYDNPCTPITRSQIFRSTVNRLVPCIGQWCIDEQYKCLQYGDKNCYHVEHIIDNNQGDLITCDDGCKEIAGNLVMAWGRWNSAIGFLGQRDYPSCLNEKRIVYGNETVNLVIDIILRCREERLKSEKEKDLNQVNLDYCDSDQQCDCNTDSNCGCDCDYTIDPAKSYSYRTPFIAVLVVASFLLIFLFGSHYYRNKREWIPVRSEVAIQ